MVSETVKFEVGGWYIRCGLWGYMAFDKNVFWGGVLVVFFIISFYECLWVYFGLVKCL